MLIEYEDLVKQLKQFREDVIKALAAIDVETAALSKAVQSQKPVLTESLNRMRAESRKRMSKFEEHYSQQLALLHESR